jgi:hypothetical protein
LDNIWAFLDKNVITFGNQFFKSFRVSVNTSRFPEMQGQQISHCQLSLRVLSEIWSCFSNLDIRHVKPRLAARLRKKRRIPSDLANFGFTCLIWKIAFFARKTLTRFKQKACLIPLIVRFFLEGPSEIFSFSSCRFFRIARSLCEKKTFFN